MFNNPQGIFFLRDFWSPLPAGASAIATSAGCVVSEPFPAGKPLLLSPVTLPSPLPLPGF